MATGLGRTYYPVLMRFGFDPYSAKNEREMLKIIRTTLREDFGLLDRGLVTRELLAEKGVRGVSDGPGKHCLSIEYDPAVLDGRKLLDVLCRHGVYPAAPEPRRDAQPRGDG